MTMERRKLPRVSIKFFVEYRGKSVWQNVQSFNLSKGGIFIATEKIEPPGTAVEIIFDVEDKRIQVESVVRWSRGKIADGADGESLPAGMGIQFLKIFPSGAEKFLKELIEKLGGENE